MGIFKKTASEKAFNLAKKTAKNAKKQATEQPLQVPVALAASLYIVKETFHGAVVVKNLTMKIPPVKYAAGTFEKAFRLAKIKSKEWAKAAEDLFSEAEKA